VNFTASSMTDIGLRMLISIHDSSGSMSQMSICCESRHWWFEKLYETWWIMFINLQLKLYRNIYIASLPCSLFVFVFLFVMIVFYTRTYEVACNRAPQWTNRGWDNFYLNALFCFKFIYIY